MIEINYIVLADMIRDMYETTELRDFHRSLRYYMKSERQLQRALYPIGYGRNWQPDAGDDIGNLRAQLGHDIDQAFTKLVILRKLYKQKTNARLFDGMIGVPRKECTEEEWESFRQDKADVLDQIIDYITINAQAMAQ